MTPRFIDRQQDLQQLAEELSSAPLIGVDTESNSFFAFRERVCLLQISTPELDALVDTLAELDFSPLSSALGDPDVITVMHDAEQDIPALKRDLGLAIRGLFDTRVACAALGATRHGLASQLEERFGVRLDKRYQRSNWGLRPLSDDQLHYAAEDTRHLPRFHAALHDELARAETLRREIVSSACRRLEQLEPPEPVPAELAYLQVKGSGRLRGLVLRAFEQLHLARDSWAQGVDMPAPKAVPSKQLIRLAGLVERDPPPTSAVDLARLAGLPAGLARRHGNWMLKALDRARKLGPLRRPKIYEAREQERLDAATGNALDRLKSWRRQRAAELGLDPALLLHRVLMTDLAKTRPQGRAALAAQPGVQAWHVEAFGDELLAAIAEPGDDAG